MGAISGECGGPRRRAAEAAPPPAVTRIAPPLRGSWTARREALRGHVARARGFAQVVRRGKDSNVAEVAAQAGMSAVRLRQLLYLLNLAPEILADIEDTQATGAVPSETVLRKLAGVRPLTDQIKAYQEMTGRVLGRGDACKPRAGSLLPTESPADTCSIYRPGIR